MLPSDNVASDGIASGNPREEAGILNSTQCTHVPTGASGSSISSSKDCVPAGGSLQGRYGFFMRERVACQLNEHGRLRYFEICCRRRRRRRSCARRKHHGKQDGYQQQKGKECTFHDRSCLSTPSNCMIKSFP